MIKVVYCITKKSGLPEEEFSAYWLNQHASLGSRIPGLRRLVQSHRVRVPGDKYQPDYDGVAELWFDDMKSLLAARNSEEWKASSEDEANFIDLKRVAYLVTEEHVILDTHQSGQHKET
jgi:uncharacterized protein (TIGR02118 family)